MAPSPAATCVDEQKRRHAEGHLLLRLSFYLKQNEMLTGRYTSSLIHEKSPKAAGRRYYDKLTILVNC